jgi:hypothetical protein
MALDPVNHKDLKGKHKNAKDKDIDNDNDVDSSDEYLHKRRQAVSKAIGKIKEEMAEERKGLWDNIHAKRKRIKAGSGEKMRKPGSKGAPTDADFRNASESVEVTEAKDGDGANIVRDREFKGKPSKTIPYAKPGESGHNTPASLFKKDGPKPAWMSRQSKMKEEAYRKPTQAEIDADRKKDEKGKPRPSISAKSVMRKTYGNMMGGLKNEEVEQIDEIQINWNHKTQKYHTIKHPDGSHWGVFDHSSYGTKGHEIRKIKDSDGNALKASDSRKNHSAGYKSGMGSPSDAAKAWAKKHGGTIVNHKIKEETEELDEISRDLARRYIRKVADKTNTGELSTKQVMKRRPGVNLAGKKAYPGIAGEPKVRATESAEFKTEAKDGDGANIVRDREFKEPKFKFKSHPYGSPEWHANKAADEKFKAQQAAKAAKKAMKNEEVELDENIGGLFKNASEWESSAKARGLVVKSMTHPSGEATKYQIAKDKQGNNRGHFDHGTKSGRLKEEVEKKPTELPADKKPLRMRLAHFRHQE